MAVGGAAGDNGNSGGGGAYGGRSGGLLGGSVSGVGLGGNKSYSYDPNKKGSITNAAGQAVNVQGGWNVSTSTGSSQNSGGGSSNGGNSGTNANAANGSNPYSGYDVAGLNKAIAVAQQNVNRTSGFNKAVYQAQLSQMQAALQSKSQPAAAQQPGAAPAQQNDAAAQQQAEAQRQAAAAAEAARQAEAARVAEQQRQQRIGVENQQRAALTQQLGQTTSAEQTQALQKQIAALGSEADNGAALNKALLDSYNKRVGEQTQQEKNSAIGAAQAGITTASPASLNYAAGPNTSSVSSAIGTAISQTDQQKNAAEAARMGGYQDTSTVGRIGNVLKSIGSGASVGGIPGALIGGAASVYSNFISDRQSASSRALTQSMNPSKPTAGEAAAGMVSGALKGSIAGPLGLALGAIWGGATAAGVAPTAEDLKGTNPLNNGITADPNSAGPGQTLANGVRVGNGNGGGNGNRGTTTAPTLPNIGGGATSNGGSGVGTPTAPNTGAPSANNGTVKDETDARNQAGQSAFNQFLDQLRKRQMDNLLYTGAGWDKTSGTSLLGRVSASQGAVGGQTGQVISQWGGGKSLLGGAWSF
ncbi:MAG: hypothetical protein [Caudoviricetes sp.]|nr:MAG: hypothetical protein [Caudoviricetes sp.]